MYLLTQIILLTNILEGRSEEEILVVLITVVTGMIAKYEKGNFKKLELSDDSKWYYYVNKEGETKKLPSNRPYKIKFGPSRKDVLRYIRQFGAASVAASSALGAFIDFVLSNADTILDGSLIGIGIAVSTLLFAGLSNSFRKFKCPYCDKFHNGKTEICPNSNLKLWYWEDQDPSSFFRRDPITGVEEIAEIICKNYYPIEFNAANEIAIQIFRTGNFPMNRNKFVDFLQESEFEELLKKIRFYRKNGEKNQSFDMED